VVHDWLWFDEGDSVNVLVQLVPTASTQQEHSYLVFEQQKCVAFQREQILYAMSKKNYAILLDQTERWLDN